MRLWENIVLPDAVEDLKKLRHQLSRYPDVSDALEQYLYSQILAFQRDARDTTNERIKDECRASADAMAGLLKCLYAPMTQDDTTDKLPSL